MRQVPFETGHLSVLGLEQKETPMQDFCSGGAIFK